MRRPIALLFFLAAASAQAPPAFEVASIKRDPWPGNSFVGVRVRGDTLTADHSCLYGLVEFAYDLRDEHLSGGPSWTRCGVLDSSELYQVIAKAGSDPPPPMAQFRLMLQTLLADRFQLQVHHVQKDLPTYNLVLAPHGSKLKKSADDAKAWMNQDARVNGGRSMRVTATHQSIEKLLAYFSHWSGRPTFDHTGLDGFYDFELVWDSDPSTPGPDPFGQGFADAIEKQLGLKLEASTGPFDTVVIDRAERPSGN